MNEKQMLELILSEIREVKATLDTHTQKIDGITEQLGKVSELEPVVNAHSKAIKDLETDLYVIKRAIRN